jgi:cyclic beta-1,2-glucan synthetase
LNRFGVEGKGENMWLAWFLIDVVARFTEVMERAGLGEHMVTYQRHAELLPVAVEKEAGTGRGHFDDGTPLGSLENRGAWIDSLPQSRAGPERSRRRPRPCPTSPRVGTQYLYY